MVSSSIANPKIIFENLIKKRGLSTIPVYSVKNNAYPKLHLFKNQIELDGDGPLQKPYSAAKSNVLTYRIIFLSIGMLYLVLGMILFFKSLTWSCTLVFGSCFLIKTIICSVCGLSSLYCITLGSLLNPEKEAVKKAYRQSKERLRKTYEMKVVKYGMKNYLLFGREYRKSMALRQIYQEASEKLHEYKEEAQQLISRIRKSSSCERNEKEELFNQAILEFKDKMELLVGTFKTINPQNLQLT
jgi:hypothetical protein